MSQSKYVFVGKRGNNLLVRDVGQQPKKVANFEYRLFEPVKEKTKYTSWDSKYNLEEINFQDIKEMTEYIENYKDISNFPIYGTPNPIHQYLSYNYSNDLMVDINDYHIDTVDIETARDPERGYAPASDPFNEILSIQIKDSRTKRFIVFVGCDKEFVPPAECTYNIEYIEASSEKGMLLNFLEYWKKSPPDIMTGWNTTFYDIPYITNRIMNYVFNDQPEIANALSPFGVIYKRNVKDDYGFDQETYNWVGIVSIDYLALYKKFTYGSKDSYKLDNIAFIELKDAKVDYSEVDNLQQLYEGKIDYNKISTIDDYTDKDEISRIAQKIKQIDDEINRRSIQP